MKKILVSFLSLALLLSVISVTTTTAAAASKVALPSGSSIRVNGGQTAFQAYTIDSNNYFKLRDIAMALKGTTKQFAVGYDGTNNAITLTTGAEYTPVGTELTFSGQTGNTYASASVSKIYLDGTLITFKAYTIGGYNYFKLRDLGTAINFGVGWDGGSNTVTIETIEEYNVGFFDPTIDYVSQKKYKVAYLTADYSIMYDLMSMEFEKWAERLNCDYSFYSASDTDVFFSIVEEYAAQGYNGLLVDPDYDGYQRTSEIMNELGMPWMLGMTAQHNLHGKDLLHPSILYDNANMGVQMATWVINYAKKTWPNAAENQIGMISLDYSIVQVIHERTTGAQSVWNATYPGQKSHFFIADGSDIGDLTEDTAYSLTANILAANPSIKYWLICPFFDDYAIGADRAVTDKGLASQSVVTSCGGANLINNWDQGKNSCWKSAVYTPTAFYAEPMICGLYALMNGKATPDTLFLAWINKNAGDKYATLMMPTIMITQDNYKEYLEWVDVYTGFNETSYAYKGTQFALRAMPPASYSS